MGSIRLESEFEIRGDGRRARIRCYSAAWTRRRSISMAAECVPGSGHVHDLYISARSGSSAPQMRFPPAARHRFSRHTPLSSFSGSAPIHIISPISPISDGPNLDCLFCCPRPVNSSRRPLCFSSPPDPESIIHSRPPSSGTTFPYLCSRGPGFRSSFFQFNGGSS